VVGIGELRCGPYLVLELRVPDVRIAHAIEVAAARRNGQDRARVFEATGNVTVVVADGAGGAGNGAAAAQAIVDAVGAAAAQAIVDAVGAVHAAPDDWNTLLLDLDCDAQRLGHGQSTAVIVSIRGGVLSGASVGDSGAWLVHNGDAIDLTEGQHRKPLVGAGCRPWHIPPTSVGGSTLLVASDGLLRYAKRSAIVRLASGEDLPAAARALVDLVRLPTGGLQDDVAVVLCRASRARGIR
jgi:serine/threonine protein phosphatase PrpC